MADELLQALGQAGFSEALRDIVVLWVGRSLVPLRLLHLESGQHILQHHNRMEETARMARCVPP